jgi:putative transposase
MPRQARPRVAGIPFHVIQRGHNRGPCFFSDADRAYYVRELGQQARGHGVAVHAYVLMTNHVHLLMTAGDPDGIPRLMKDLSQRYVRRVNRRLRRTGTLWEGRYHCCLVDTEGYLLTCHRYIELNPVRAGMVGDPGDYRWSSYRANALGARDAVLSAHPVMESLGSDIADRRIGYRHLFERDLSPIELEQIRASTNGGFAFGSARFQAEMGLAVKRRMTRLRRRPARKSRA